MHVAYRTELIDFSSGNGALLANIVGRVTSTGYSFAPILYAANFSDNLCANPFPAGTFNVMVRL